MSILGPPPISAAELAERILADSDLSWDWGERPVKALLYNLGRAAALNVSCRKQGLPKDVNVHEWLLDLVWMDKTGMKLAVESEWSRVMAHRLDDFEKLMSIKSPLKLFIYATGSPSESGNVHRELTKYMQGEDEPGFSQHLEGEEYILMEIRDGNAHFYHYTVPNTGSVTKVAFAPLELKEGSSA